MTVETTAESGSPTVTAPSGAVSALETFLGDHGGSGKAVLQPVGRTSVRITAVGADGILGDAVVATLAEAHAVVDAVAGLETSDWDRELTSVVTPKDPEHWKKMAGWVAHQTRFPKALNER